VPGPELHAGSGAADVAAWLDANRITWVRTDGSTLDGMVAGKHVHRSKFVDTLPDGVAISEILFGMDLAGSPYFSWWPDWRRDALGDVVQRPDVSTLAVLPGRTGVASVIVEHHALDGSLLPVCSRGTLHALIDKVAAAGYSVTAAFELEGMLFTDPLTTARRQHFRRLTPMAHPAAFGYSNYNSAHSAPYLDELATRLLALGLPVEGWHDEAAPGQFEVNFAPLAGLAAADAIMRAKQVARELALERGCSVTFMAKPTEFYGNGLHVHHSLRTVDGDRPVFTDADGAMSAVMQSWLAGIVATMPGATSLLSPTINSFRRMIDWAAVPTTATWAEDNKTTGVRVLTRSPGSARIEHRGGAGDANPYLVLAAVLAGGLAGLAEPIELPPAHTVSGWGLPDGWPHLPASIIPASEALAADVRLRAQVGDAFVDHWVETRKWEWLMFHTTGGDASATAVTDWELDRSFELA
jgi:glutamine synthetase